jgi:hypothetical protein
MPHNRTRGVHRHSLCLPSQLGDTVAYFPELHRRYLTLVRKQAGVPQTHKNLVAGDISWLYVLLPRPFSGLFHLGTADIVVALPGQRRKSKQCSLG